MTRLPKQAFTQEFRELAVKSVVESKLSVSEAERRLDMSATTLTH